MDPNGDHSPMGVDEPLEYITVASYEWPKPPPPKRSRLDEQERRRRHTECQKRFLKRKQHQFEQLKNDVRRLELELKLIEAIRETEVLRADRRRLQAHPAADHAIPNEYLMRTVEPQPAQEASDGAHFVESLDVDALVAELGPL